jgi:small-conductance mechanosensitive channel
VCLVAALVAVALPALAETKSGDPSDAEDAAKYETAPVSLDGELLFRVRGTTAYPAGERAEAIRERIKLLASDSSVSTDSLRLIEAEDRTEVVAPGHFIMAVYDVDGATERSPRQIFAGTVRNKVARSVDRYREDRTPSVVLANTIRALVVILVALTLLWVTSRLFRRLRGALNRRLQSRIEKLRTMSGRVAQTETLSALIWGLLKAARVLGILVIAYFCLNIVLGFYPWTRSLSKQVMSIVLDPLRAIGAAFVDALPGLVFVVVLWIVTRYVLKVIRLFFAGVDQNKITIAGFENDWAWPTYRIARFLILAFAVVVAYPYIPGSGSEAFKGVSLFLGVVFSLGSSSIVANVIAGYSMIYRRAFKIGDRIKIGEIEGIVSSAGVIVTHLRTLKNEDVVVPNSLILNSNVTNYSTLARTRGLILHTTVGIGYETPWRQVEAMLNLAAERTPGLLKEPPPFILLRALGDFAVTYELNVYTDDPPNLARLYAELHRHVLDVFNEYGVQIMTPAYEGDPEQPKVVPKGEWFAPPADGARFSAPEAPSPTPGL